ncbi:hypothetical protein PHYSODRAFT_386744, partial [Phytophthora sojae]
LSFSHFIQYKRYYVPGVRLKRTAEDVCDCCVRLDILLQQPDISEEEREVVLLEKRTHLNEAIAQRRFVSNFVKDYTALHAPQQILPNQVIPHTIDDSTVVQIQAEDYGGGISMPYYALCRPSADYFNCNLMIQNFVIADITNEQNNVYF